MFQMKVPAQAAFGGLRVFGLGQPYLLLRLSGFA
jgi:hypothetical protein